MLTIKKDVIIGNNKPVSQSSSQSKKKIVEINDQLFASFETSSVS